MIRLVSVVLLVACGSRSTPTSHPEPHRDGVVAHGETRSDEQCDKLIAHALSLAVAERPADQKLGDDERTAIQTQLRKTWLPSCKQMTARGYDCVLAAPTLAAVDACGN